MSAEPVPVAFDTVTSYLTWDHGRLDASLAEVARLVCDGKAAEARAAYPAYEAGLLRHLRIEEELLFPVFDARSGFVGGPTAAMRSEHREIRRAAVLVREALAVGDADAFREAFAFLREILEPHASREEHILFPTTDQLLTPAERCRLAARLQEE